MRVALGNYPKFVHAQVYPCELYGWKLHVRLCFVSLFFTGSMTPGLTLGTLYSSGVGINKTKQHSELPRRAPQACHGAL